MILDYILPIILTTLSGFVFLQNKKPVLKRPLAFDNPWAPLIYIPTGLIGPYLLFRIGIWSLVLGWLFSLILAQLLSSVIYRKKGFPEKLEDHFDEMNQMIFPGGPKQIKEEAKKIMDLVEGKLNFKESEYLLNATAYLFATSEDKSEQRMVEHIMKKTNGKLNHAQAQQVFKFIFNKFYDMFKRSQNG